VLSLNNVTKSFAKVRAIDGIDLALEPGKTTVLIGPSGCGKSTLLRMLNGLIEPDRGDVRWDGVRLGDHNLQSVRQRQGYVIQDGGLFPHLSGRDNVALLPRFLGWDAGKIESRTRDLAELTRLPVDLLNRFPREISGGQRQRVSLMRALMLDPEVLLLDEPLGALDPMIRADLQTDLRVIFEELHRTVIMVTHDLAEANFFADTVILMNEGRVVQEGSMQDLVSAPTHPFVTRFVEAQFSTHLRS
jgi:osmoprotectant transport system ATP-binding protein